MRAASRIDARNPSTGDSRQSTAHSNPGGRDRLGPPRGRTARSGSWLGPLRSTIDTMRKERLEAFTDGVMAILLTIMVLDLRVPHGVDWNALAPLLPVFLTYILSFVVLGIYWNNHHVMFHAVTRVTGAALWANL